MSRNVQQKILTAAEAKAFTVAEIKRQAPGRKIKPVALNFGGVFTTVVLKEGRNTGVGVSKRTTFWARKNGKTIPPDHRNDEVGIATAVGRAIDDIGNTFTF